MLTAPPPPDLTPAAQAAQLEQVCAQLGSVVVAYSGGVDSAVLLMASHRALGKKCVGVLATSESYPPWELTAAVEQAKTMGAVLRTVVTQELDNPQYRANTGNRCYWCKSALFDACEAVRKENAFDAVAYGANLDDLGDDRPGHTAAAQRHIASPLITARMGKASVRAVAAHYGLKSAHKPALACLSSRFPKGTPIDESKLRQVAAAELALVELGFAQVRVRYHGDLARIETDPAGLSKILDPQVRQQVVDGVARAGFAHVTVDLHGYVQGGANAGAARLPIL